MPDQFPFDAADGGRSGSGRVVVRAFILGAFFVVVLALVMDVAHSADYTSEDTMSLGLYGFGVILVALGFMAGKQR